MPLAVVSRYEVRPFRLGAGFRADGKCRTSVVIGCVSKSPHVMNVQSRSVNWPELGRLRDDSA
jgi:hypothetical protein